MTGLETDPARGRRTAGGPDFRSGRIARADEGDRIDSSQASLLFVVTTWKRSR
jgi:hypothetical protein